MWQKLLKGNVSEICLLSQQNAKFYEYFVIHQLFFPFIFCLWLESECMASVVHKADYNSYAQIKCTPILLSGKGTTYFWGPYIFSQVLLLKDCRGWERRAQTCVHIDGPIRTMNDTCSVRTSSTPRWPCVAFTVRLLNYSWPYFQDTKKKEETFLTFSLMLSRPYTLR